MCRIIQIECLHDPDFIYAVLPFCNGGELFSVVESGGAMDERECRHWFTQVLAGLSFLQSRYICHRDMSLENVLLDGDISKVLLRVYMCSVMVSSSTWQLTRFLVLHCRSSTLGSRLAFRSTRMA